MQIDGASLKHRVREPFLTRDSSRECKMLFGNVLREMHNLKNVNFRAKECPIAKTSAFRLAHEREGKRAKEGGRSEYRCTSLN